MLHTGNTLSKGAYRDNLQRAVAFIMKHVEQSPAEGLEVTNLKGTQIQRKLGPYIDTFLSAKLLGELAGNMGNAQANARVRQDLQKCVAKIEKNQLQEGSWNIAGAWGPIFGMSLALQSLNMAMAKGVAVKQMAMAKVQEYTEKTASAGGVGSSSGGGIAPGVAGGVVGGVLGGVPRARPEQPRRFLTLTPVPRL